MLMSSKVIYQSQGSFEIKLGGNCKFVYFLNSLSPITTKLDLQMQYVNFVLGEWVGLSLT